VHIRALISYVMGMTAKKTFIVYWQHVVEVHGVLVRFGEANAENAFRPFSCLSLGRGIDVHFENSIQTVDGYKYGKSPKRFSLGYFSGRLYDFVTHSVANLNVMFSGGEATTIAPRCANNPAFYGSPSQC